jgi:hypothetical protein
LQLLIEDPLELYKFLDSAPLMALAQQPSQLTEPLNALRFLVAFFA